MSMVRVVPRGCTTLVDAYLTPVIKRYLQSFCAGFDSNLRHVKINFMQSDGTARDRAGRYIYMSHLCRLIIMDGGHLWVTLWMCIYCMDVYMLFVCVTDCYLTCD